MVPLIQNCVASVMVSKNIARDWEGQREGEGGGSGGTHIGGGDEGVGIKRVRDGTGVGSEFAVEELVEGFYDMH